MADNAFTFDIASTVTYEYDINNPSSFTFDIANEEIIGIDFSSLDLPTWVWLLSSSTSQPSGIRGYWVDTETWDDTAKWYD